MSDSTIILFLPAPQTWRRDAATDAERHIADAVKSILLQTYTNFEFIIIDDNSSDRTLDIISTFARLDSRVKVVKNRGRKGIVGSLNTGLMEAKGEFIARADADDVNRLDRLEIEVSFLRKYADIFVVGGGYAPFNEKGHRLDIFHPRSSVEIAWRYISNSFLCHPSIMFRKSLIEEVGLYPEAYAEDFVYFSKITRTTSALICLRFSLITVNRRLVCRQRARV